MCLLNWQGLHCETPVNYCSNVTCLNNGVCRLSSQNYTCECLGDSYSGRHCEVKASQLAVRQAVSRSFAYVAICALIIVGIFVVVMDVLKYFFGIDPARDDREREQKQTKKVKEHTAIRFIYVPSPSNLN